MEKESEFTKRCLYASSYFREQEFKTTIYLGGYACFRTDARIMSCFKRVCSSG